MPDAPAPAPEGAAPAAPAKPAPGEVSQAGRTLAAARSKYEDRLDDPGEAKPAPAEPPKTELKEEPKPEPKTDEILTLAKRERAIAAREKAIADREAKLKEAESGGARWKAAEELAGQGKFIDAVKALKLTPEQLFVGNQSLFWALGKLAEEAPGQEDKPDVAQIVADELKRKEDERKANEEKERNERVRQQNERAAQVAEEIDGQVLQALKANPAKYPHVTRAKGIPPEDIVNLQYLGKTLVDAMEADDEVFTKVVQRYAARFERSHDRKPTRKEVETYLEQAKRPGTYQAWFEHFGRPPTADEILQHHEQAYAQHFGGSRPDPQERPPSPMDAPAKVQDGKTTATGKPATLEEARRRMEAKLEELERQQHRR